MTLAPECGSDRMRRILNKRFTNAEILDKATWIFENGIQNLKLYYMVGLPWEEPSDVEAIVTLTAQIRERMLAVGRILGTLGSPVHSEGWGVSTSKGFFKSTVPMYLSSVAGQNIEKVPGGGHLGALIGHIRQASPLIPIKLENCHPFVSPENNIIFVHNGKLGPKDEKKFVMEIDVPDLDAKGFKQYDKDNKLKMKKEKRSDSLIFFEEFLLTWQENQKAGDTKTQDAYFVEVL